MAAFFVCLAGSIATASYSGVWFARLPPPSGPWPIGTVLRSIKPAIAGETPLSVRIWYPARSGMSGPRASYAYGSRGLPFKDRLVAAIVRTQSRVSVPVAEKRFPLIIYVAGAGGIRINNTALAQELASHGFVVAAIDDTHPEIGLDFSSPEAVRSTIVNGERKARLQASDVVRVIDGMSAFDVVPRDVFSERLDMSHIGAIGFSFGGTVAAQAASIDSRIGAVVNLDGGVYGAAANGGIDRPFFMLTSDHETESNIEASFDRENMMSVIEGMGRHAGCVATIKGMEHYNFSDAAVLPTIRRTGLGSIDPARGTRIISRYVVAFYDRWLLGQPEALFDANDSFDDAVTLRKYGLLRGRGTTSHERDGHEAVSRL